MTADLYADLGWLPRPPEDFRQRCRAVAGAADPVAALSRLANYALDEIKLRKLAATSAEQRATGSLAPLTPFVLGVVGNGSLEPLLPVLEATALRHGLDLTCVGAAYGQTLQEALDPASTLNAGRPDAVLLALDHRGLPLHAALNDATVPAVSALNDASVAANAVAESLAFVDGLRGGFRAHAGAACIVQTLAPPPEALFGSLDRAIPGTPRSLCTAFNAALTAALAGTSDVLFDVAALAETVGLANWHAPTQWNVGKLPFGAAFLPLYAEHVCRLIAALRGKSRKCLILDLDNTLWGGVLGDDGLEGIVLGQGDATGEAYLDVQRSALALRERGIVLAVSSKNADATARAVFSEHPDMLLREAHIAVFQANWNDKATNIAAIASELNLGLDAMVFLDDNPAERGLVRELLPQVAVPELPDDPALYARTLAAAGYFEAVALSEEDLRRAGFYQDNARRIALQSAVGDVDAYLASLRMEIGFRPFDAIGRARIAQLINKSNQFNLTTRRYTELEVAALEADPACFTLQVRLVDALGDNGMIGVVVCRAAESVQPAERSEPAVWEIDTWLMSCRVLGRGVEQMVLRELLHHARAGGVRTLRGTYIPTSKNALVRDHYSKLGFRLVAEESSGATTWELATDTEVQPAPMRVDRSGFERVSV